MYQQQEVPGDGPCSTLPDLSQLVTIWSQDQQNLQIQVPSKASFILSTLLLYQAVCLVGMIFQVQELEIH
jgi:hypothetical protein